jgi:hypothetical protein
MTNKHPYTICRFILLIVLLMSGAVSRAQAPVPGQISGSTTPAKKSALPSDPFDADAEGVQKVLKDFCAIAEPKSREIDDWIKAHKKVPPEIPVPPALESGCADCNLPDNESPNKALADSFMARATRPESDMIKTLVTIRQALNQLTGSDPNSLDNTPACMKQMTSDKLADMTIWLFDRIYDKAMGMAKQYYKQAEMEYAGVRFLLACERQRQLLGLNENNYNISATEYAGKWLQSYFDKYEERLTKQYQYQVYPHLLPMIRELDHLTGGDPNSSQHDYLAQQMYELAVKLKKFMHFKLKVDFEAQGHGEKGEKYHTMVIGETEVVCNLERTGCYSWDIADTGKMTFKVVDVVFTSDQGVAVYKGPQTFTVPVSLHLNVCDASPVLRIDMDRFGPVEETYVSSEGGEFQAPLLNSLASATLGSANMGKMMAQAQSMPGNTSSPKQQQAVDAAAKRLRQHQGDTNYIKTAQGKADFELMGKMGHNISYDPKMRPDPGRMQNLANLHKMNEAYRARDAKMRQAGYVGSEAYYKDQARIDALRGNVDINAITTPVGLNLSLLRVEVPFTTGVQLVVDKVERDKISDITGSKSGWEFGAFHVVMEHTPLK